MYAKPAKTPRFCVLRFGIVYLVYLPDKSCGCNFFNTATCPILMNSRTVTEVRTSLTPAPGCRRNERRGAHPIDGGLFVSYLKISEVCIKYRVSDDTVRRWFSSGVKRFGQQHTLAAFKVGGTWRIDEQDLTQFLHNLQVTKPRQRAESRASTAARELSALANLLRPTGRSSRAPRRSGAARTPQAKQ